mmetsp:Transcript_25581/g.29219  ORF Transcript_25581/g.29219 Transcript_25581/m.29219 type:complete len:442 (+) Transcript_25581:63-1388(+)
MSDRESTPLLSSAKGGGRLDPTNLHNIDVYDVGQGRPTRRRNGPQQYEHFGSHTPAPPTPPRSMPSQEAGDDSSKKSRRTIFQKLSTSASMIKEIIIPVSNSNNSNNGTSNYSKNNSISPMNMDSRYSQRKGFAENEYYEDSYNDLPWKCSFGTSENDGIWMNTSDISGIIMSSMVWIMIIYSGFTVTLLSQNNALNGMVAIIYCTLCALALASHAKTTFSDPGAVPQSAVPTEDVGSNNTEFPMCSVCGTYKPNHCHHCRICNRCICGMDHHCPWMNNCIGSGNFKHFILFLAYVWLASAYALSLFAVNYFLCNSEECAFPDVLVQLVRIMTVLCIGAITFTSSMIMNVLWGIMTGLGTIDRMKKEEANTMNECDEEPIPWTNIFGIQGFYTWILPIDPIFLDYDSVMGYSTVQRLLREKQLNESVKMTREESSIRRTQL